MAKVVGAALLVCALQAWAEYPLFDDALGRSGATATWGALALFLGLAGLALTDASTWWSALAVLAGCGVIAGTLSTHAGSANEYLPSILAIFSPVAMAAAALAILLSARRSVEAVESSDL